MHITWTSRRLLAATAAGVLVISLAGACGSDDSDDGGKASDQVVGDGGNSTTTTDATTDATTTTAAEGDGEGDGAVEAVVVATDFKLTSVEAAPGSDVGFQNQGGATHTLTADDDSFDTGNVASGESSSVTAPSTPGTYPYHCNIHASMKGTLTVTG